MKEVIEGGDCPGNGVCSPGPCRATGCVWQASVSCTAAPPLGHAAVRVEPKSRLVLSWCSQEGREPGTASPQGRGPWCSGPGDPGFSALPGAAVGKKRAGLGLPLRQTTPPAGLGARTSRPPALSAPSLGWGSLVFPAPWAPFPGLVTTATPLRASAGPGLHAFPLVCSRGTQDDEGVLMNPKRGPRWCVHVWHRV